MIFTDHNSDKLGVHNTSSNQDGFWEELKNHSRERVIVVDEEEE